MKVLVMGVRHFSNYSFIVEKLNQIFDQKTEEIVIMVDHANITSKISEKYAKERGLSILFPDKSDLKDSNKGSSISAKDRVQQYQEDKISLFKDCDTLIFFGEKTDKYHNPLLLSFVHSDKKILFIDIKEAIDYSNLINDKIKKVKKER